MSNIPELVARVQQAMADYKAGLAKEAAGIATAAIGRAEAQAAVVKYGAALSEGRKKFASDTEFGQWVHDSGFDAEKPWQDHDVRWAARQVAEAAVDHVINSDFSDCTVTSPRRMWDWCKDRIAFAEAEAAAAAALLTKQQAEAERAAKAEADARAREEAALQAKRDAEAAAVTAAEAEARRREREAAEAEAEARRREEAEQQKAAKAAAEKERKEHEDQKDSRSKLNAMFGPAAAKVVMNRFKHWGSIRNAFDGVGKALSKRLGNYLAECCQAPDYPEVLLGVTWSAQMLYPHLPKRLLDHQPKTKTISGLGKIHSTLVETERRFKMTPEFGMTDPPLAAFNKAHAIMVALLNAQSAAKDAAKYGEGSGTMDPKAKASTKYRDDEGKSEVIIMGTRLWPILEDATATYNYDDLRCAHGFVDDVFKTFLEPRDSSMDTKLLKVRHLLSWVNGGYNAKGATLAGTFEAIDSVVTAYARKASPEMKTPGVRFDKNDGNARGT